MAKRKLILFIFLICILSGCARNIASVHEEKNDNAVVMDTDIESSGENDQSIYDGELIQHPDDESIAEKNDSDKDNQKEDAESSEENKVSPENKSLVIPSEKGDVEFYDVKSNEDNPVIKAFLRYISDREGYYYIWNSPKANMPVLIMADSCVDMWENIGEEAAIFGESSRGILFIADEDQYYKVMEIGTIGDSSSSLTSLRCDENGIYTKTNHGAYCFAPDFDKKELKIVSGAEDEVINDYCEHPGTGIDIFDGNMRETDTPDLEGAYERYDGALRMRFQSTPLARKEKGKPDKLIIPGKDLSADQIAERYTVNLAGDGQYSLYEGNIGEVIPEYKDIDIDGDGKIDTINRILEERDGIPWNYYTIDFYYGRKLEIRNGFDGFSAHPNEGEVFEFYDIDKDGCDEILVTHYTFGTGGSTVWNTALYSCNELGEWKMIPIVGERAFDPGLNKLIANLRLSDDYDPSYRIRKTCLTEKGVDVVVDFGYKDGPMVVEILKDYSMTFEHWGHYLL